MIDYEKYMQEALTQAREAFQNDEIPIGAIIVCGGEIIARGRNTVIESVDMTCHAEINALREACKVLNNYRLPDCTLYTTLEPCSMCAGAIIESRIKKLVIGAADPKRGTVISNFKIINSPVSNTKMEIVHGVLAEDCLKIIKDFFKKKRMKD